MLHELLLALSGHASPLLSTSKAGFGHEPFGEHLSPAESALLQSLAHDLGDRHRKIRDAASVINASHPSIVCRAVTTSIVSTHLARFQRVILDVEKDILEENPNIVGAYKIVPLSGVVGAFDGWGRRLEWLLGLVDFIESPNGSKTSSEQKQSCSARQIIGRLRDATHTGYLDIEQMSYELVKVAEKAWLKQAAAWLLYGRLPALGASDFFIYKDTNGKEDKVPGYLIDPLLIPPFVTQTAASSVLFIGKSLTDIKARASLLEEGIDHTRSPELLLLPSHLAHLSSLESPITATSFSTAVSAIRLSLSRNALQKLLPISKVLEILRILKDFFLLERGEFAIALITAADQCLSARQSRYADKPLSKGADGLKSALIKDGEVSAVLARTWASIASLQGVDDDDEDEDLELARELINLSNSPLDHPIPENGNVVESGFDHILLPTPTLLGLRVPSPLDLFLTPSDVNKYSCIHAYLLSIRRAHLRLSKLFLLSVLRRVHPSPKAPYHQPEKERTAALSRMRDCATQRAKTLRPIWATIRSAAFFLTETGEYFQGEVIRVSWQGFHTWLDPTCEDKASRPGSAHSALGILGASTSSQRSVQPPEPAVHDPESLAVAHRTYLSSLIHALLLDDGHFTKELQAFMRSVDILSALLARLDGIYQHLDLESNYGIVDTFTNYTSEEKEVMRELGSAREKVASGVQALVAALRDIDSARAAGGSHKADVQVEGEDRFVPLMSGGVDRLLLKLDFVDLQRESSMGTSS